MPSDGRYMYHHPQGMPSQYDYAYPPSYENTQIPQQSPLRPMRSGSSHSPHPQPQFNTAQSHSPYQSAAAYSATPYGMTQPTSPQWSGDNWSQYSQSFPPPPPPIPEGPFNSGPGRPDPVPAVLAEQRAYPSPQANPEPRRNDDRHAVPPTPAGPVSQAKTKRRDRESPSIGGLPGTPPGLDFMKLLDSYRLIIDSGEALSTSALSAQGRPPPAETVERMLQSALYGMQMLESATVQQSAPPQDTRPPADRNGEDAKEATNGSSSSSKRQKTEESTVVEGQTCLGCKATSTPEWRRGPMGPRTLCNACGLVYAKLIKKRVREGTFGKMNGQVIASSQVFGDESGLVSSGDGGSDDEDSYGSQDRRSDVGGA